MSLENLNLAKIEDKIGGRFRMVTLFQKRIRELQRGLPPLVDTPSTSLEEIVAEEVMQGKIWLAQGAEADALRLDRAEELKQIEHMRAEAPPPVEEKPVAPPPAPEAAPVP